MEQIKTTQIDYLTIGLFIAIAAVMLFMPDISFAGTGGTEFADAEERVTGIIEGTGGKLVAVISLVFALVGSVLKFNPIAVASSVGVGILASLGPAIVQTGITAVV